MFPVALFVTLFNRRQSPDDGESNSENGIRGSGISPYGISRLPVFGRVLNRELMAPPPSATSYQPLLQPLARGAGYRGGLALERRPGSLYRRYAGISGGNTGDHLSRPSAKKQDGTGQSILGSFQKVKQLIWNERAKEQTQQRQAQDLALKAYALRHLAQGEK